MNFLRNLFGKKSKGKDTMDIAVELMTVVVDLMVQKNFNPSAPEVTAYLRDIATPDIMKTISGCDDLLEQYKAAPKSFMMNPEAIANTRKALVEEVKRRGETHLLNV